MLKALLDEHDWHPDKAQCLCHPILKNTPVQQIIEEFKTQLNAYWLGKPPFHSPVVGGDAMEWWEDLEVGRSPRSAVLEMLGVRIFSILVNSMPDERTNSNITWFNSPLRGNQAPERLVDMIIDAKGPARPPRRPTVAFRRLNREVLEKTMMKARMKDDDDSISELESDSDSDADLTKSIVDEELRKQQEALDK
ncbi:hypothetical protein K438DRAFT_1963056 [Mycena galopus ATCC 62051]|nr:hypothetical protein K438DRAFT_1963056 [Mycena galopus ATCC 62051]